MRYIILTVTAALCLALVSSHPLPEDGLRSEALDRLVMAEADSEAALRSKRTIGILRQFFPEISQRIEEKVNMIVAEVIRALGPLVLRNLLGGNNGGNNGGTTTQIEGSLFDDDDDDDDDDNDDKDKDKDNSDNGDSNVSLNSRVSISLPTFSPDEDDTTDAPNTTSTTTTTMMAVVDLGDIDEAAATTTTTTSTTAATTTAAAAAIIPPAADNEVTTTL